MRKIDHLIGEFGKISFREGLTYGPGSSDYLVIIRNNYHIGDLAFDDDKGCWRPESFATTGAIGCEEGHNLGPNILDAIDNLLTLDSPPPRPYVCLAYDMKKVTAMRFKVTSRVRRSARRSEPGSSVEAHRPGCVGATASSVRAAAIAGFVVRHAGRRISATAAGSGPRSPQARSSIRPSCRRRCGSR